MTDLFLSIHVFIRPTPYLRYKTNVLASISMQSKRLCSMLYVTCFIIRIKIQLFVFICILSILRYILSMYVKTFQPLDMRGFPCRKRLSCEKPTTETSSCKNYY